MHCRFVLNRGRGVFFDLIVAALMLLFRVGIAHANGTEQANPTTGVYASQIYWMDWTGYSIPTTGGSQNYSFTLADGSTLSLTLTRGGTSTATVAAVTLPTYGNPNSGAAMGNVGYCFPTCGTGTTPGSTSADKLALYSTSAIGTNLSFELSNIVLTNPAGNSVQNFEIVMADAESTDTGDGAGANWTFTTTGGNWNLVERVPATGRAAVTLSGIGTQTVIQPAGTAPDPAWVLSTANPSTGTFSATAKTTSTQKQGIMLGMRLGSVSLNKNIVGRSNPADQFAYQILNSATPTPASIGAGTGACAAVGPCTTTGATTGNQIAISAAVATGNTVTLEETMAAGSVGTLAGYTKLIQCTNSNTGSSTVLPGNGASVPYDPANPPQIALQSADDLISCVISNSVADITLTKAGPATVLQDTAFDYTLNLGNSGSAASGATVTVADVLPAGVTANSVGAGTGVTAVNCGTLPSAPGATLTCTVTLSAALAAGAANGTAGFTINATAADTGSVTNYASVDPTGGTNPPAPGATCAPATSCGGATTSAYAPPSIAKAFGAASIPLNGITSLDFTITNPNASLALSGLAFTDTLPAGLVVATPNGLANSCNGTATATAGSTSVDLSAGTLAAGASCTVTVDVLGSASGVQNNSVTVTSTEGGTGNTSTATITVIAPPTISKVFGAASIPLNGSTSLSFTVSNPNTTNSLSGVSVTDTLPAGLTIATPNGLAGPCGGGTITATAGSANVGLSGALLSAGASCTFSVNVTGIAAGQQNNTTGNVTSNEGGTGGTASASAAVVAPPSIAKAFNPATIAVNGITTLTLTITNPVANTIAETGVAFTDTFPADLVVATPNGLTNTCGGTPTAVAGSGSVALTGGSIAVDNNCTVTVNVTSTTSGAYTNTTAPVSSTNGGTGNSATANLSVAAPPSIAKAFGATTVALNGTTSLTFNITNPNANVALMGLTFTDSLPAGLVVATPSNLNNPTCGGTATAVAGSGAVSLSGGTLAANANCTLSVNVQGTTVGVKNNSVQVTSTQGGTGNTSTATTSVVAPPTIAKAFNPASISVNGTATLTLIITNPNATQGLSGVAFSDSFPAGMTVASPPGAANSCNGTFTATAGANSINLANGTLAASGTCTITVSVTDNTSGSANNTTGAVTSNEGGAGTTSNTATLTVNTPSLGVSKTSNGPWTVGQTSPAPAYTLTVSNSGNAATSGTITVDDTLPTGITAAATFGSGSWTCTTTGQAVSCTNPTSLAATGGSSTITLPVTVGAAAVGNVTNNASVGGGGDPNNGGNPPAPGSCTAGDAHCGSTSTAVNVPKLTVTKTANGPWTVGQTTPAPTYTITVTNSNTATAASSGNIVITDTLPTGITLTGTSGTNWSCTGTTALTCTFTGSITVGGNSALTLNVAIGASATSGNNTATMTGGGDTTCPGGANCTNTVTVAINSPSLGVSKTSNGPWTVGQTSPAPAYTLTVSNSGNAATSGTITVDDTLPTGITAAATFGSGSWTCTTTGQAVSCTNPTSLAATGGSSTITLPVTVGAAAVGNVTNNASVGGGGDPNNGGNPPAPGSCTAGDAHCGSASTAIISPPTVAKSFNPTSIAAGGKSTLTISLTNTNTTALTGVSMTDTLPTGMTVAASNTTIDTCGGTATAASSSGMVSLSGGTIPASGNCTVTVTVTSSKSGSAVNTIAVGSVTSTNGGSNTTTGTATLTVTGGSAAAVTPTPALDLRSLLLLALAILAGAVWLRRTEHA